ncbi:hypothetical protein BT93_D1579 [Corymbia citriodora subsp. variegata]|nr:hypothetical protein BT93_D1579 [Corymbia citriodora subsp. variegata]
MDDLFTLLKDDNKEMPCIKTRDLTLDKSYLHRKKNKQHCLFILFIREKQDLLQTHNKV